MRADTDTHGVPALYPSVEAAELGRLRGALASILRDLQAAGAWSALRDAQRRCIYEAQDALGQATGQNAATWPKLSDEELLEAVRRFMALMGAPHTLAAEGLRIAEELRLARMELQARERGADSLPQDNGRMR